MRINLFYPTVLLVGVGLYFLLQSPATAELNFFGFAESAETMVNYNYPVVIEEILVSPGQEVTADQPLLRVSRRKARESLSDQQFRIDELRAEQRLWEQRRRDELTRDDDGDAAAIAELEARREELLRQLDYQRSLAEGLRTIAPDSADYRPLEDRLARLEARLAERRRARTTRREQAGRELQLGQNPYREQIRRLEAELEFEEQQRIIPLVVRAPSDGLVGNVMVREQEHVPSYDPLLSFYAPHSELIRGYVHEDLTASVNLGDTLEVFSLRVPDLVYNGVVTGLGSRIVETPTRLRKVPEIKTYGREVIVAIPAANAFLQKEKVGLRRSPTALL